MISEKLILNLYIEQIAINTFIKTKFIMRTNRFFFSMLVLLGTLLTGGCSDDPTENTTGPAPQLSEITLATEAVTATFAGEDLSIDFTIENPINGAELGFKSSADWVTNLSATEEKILFTVLANESTEVRTATVTISYDTIAEAAKFTITQSGYEAPNSFEIEIESVEAASCITEVKPLDPEMYYIMYLVPVTYFSEVGITTAEEMYETDKEKYMRNADFDSMSVGEYLIQYNAVFQGNIRAQWSNLIPGKKYCIYAYGIEFNEKMTDYTLVTDMAYEIITTEVSELREITFDVNITLDGPEATAEITPNGYEGYYVVEYHRTDDILYLPEGEEVDEEYIALVRDYWIDLCSNMMMYGYTVEDIHNMYGIKGASNKTTELRSNSSYSVVIFAVEENGGFSQMVSAPHVVPIQTDPVEMSDMKLDIKVENIGSRVADISVTPSIIGEQYLFLLMPSDYITLTDDNEIISELLTNYVRYASFFKEEMTSHVSTLYANTKYSIFCFGYHGQVPTTELFRYDFETEEEGVGEISVVDIDICGPYDPVALAEAMPEKYGHYADYGGGYYYLISYETITDQPCDDIFHLIWYLMDYEYYMEYMPDLVLSDLLALYHDPIEVEDCEYNWEMIATAVAMDKKGNISEMFTKEFIYEMDDEYRPIDELVAKLTAPESRAKVMAVGQHKADMQPVKQDLVYHKDRQIQAPRRR